MIEDNIILILYVALVVDLFFKNRKYKKVKDMMPNYKRYQVNTTTLKYVLYGIILALSAAFLAFHIYVSVSGSEFFFPKVLLALPIIDYYCIWDILFNGIYYNKHAVFYKSELYEFRNCVHIYRDEVKDHYEYDITYREKEGGLRNIIMKVPNEPEAFELLMMIPFEEEETQFNF